MQDSSQCVTAAISQNFRGRDGPIIKVSLKIQNMDTAETRNSFSNLEQRILEFLIILCNVKIVKVPRKNVASALGTPTF